jgi:ribonucleoside-diphosphate reductase alpha chain
MLSELSTFTAPSRDPGNARVARFVWETRYRYRTSLSTESGLEDTWQRVADAVAAVESKPQAWREPFLEILHDYRFLPGGRILAGAGTAHQVTLCNCFVIGAVEDSIEGIFNALKEGAVTMQQGGGVGYDFSTLRPHGSRARTTGMTASGPVSFMRVWDAMCATILSTGARRGAMMATLRCDHPDIEEFIAAKLTPGALQHFNLSVLVSDAFMQAVHDDADWPLVFPEHDLAEPGTTGGGQLKRCWTGSTIPVACRVHKTMHARALWRQLCDCAYEGAEPGVLFIDRINAMNNLGYCELLSATNPCAEEPLPAYGACNLGSINLCAFVVGEFTPVAHIAEDAIATTTRLAVRFLDNVIDLSRFPLPRQQQQARHSRRIGLGITGLADALAMLGLSYDSAAARRLAAHLMRLIRDTAYETSIELAAQKGAFPALDVTRYLERPFVVALPEAMRAAIRRQGIRNSHLTAIAPAGTISLLAGNVSSGIEPIFSIESLRRVLDPEGNYHNFQTTDYAYAIWRTQHPTAATIPDSFIAGDRISPADQLSMLAALQPSVDGSISKTVMLPKEFARDDVPTLFWTAYKLGLKGCAVYRARARTGVIADRRDLETASALEAGDPSCAIDRECD